MTHSGTIFMYAHPKPPIVGRTGHAPLPRFVHADVELGHRLKAEIGREARGNTRVRSREGTSHDIAAVAIAWHDVRKEPGVVDEIYTVSQFLHHI